MNNSNRDFKGVWIPKEIWINEDLGWTEKLLLVEIHSLDNENGCYATNDYFANFFNLSKDRISRMVSALKEKGYISVDIKTDKSEGFKRYRIIKVDKVKFHGMEEKVSVKTTRGIGENTNTGIGENTNYNNTLINNTINNNNIVEQTRQHENQAIEYVVNFLNTTAETNYRAATKKTRDLIKARFKEGFTIQDFEKVINIKCKEWLNNDYSKFLRPETLFGNKFESYLQQKELNVKSELWEADIFGTTTNSDNYETHSKQLPGTIKQIGF